MKSATAASPVSFRTEPNVIGSRVRSSAFTWSPESRAFVGEASSLGRAGIFRRLFADAADQGFVLVSDASGSEALFAFAGEERDEEEGEITAWIFCPTAETVRRLPALQGVRVICLND